MEKSDANSGATRLWTERYNCRSCYCIVKELENGKPRMIIRHEEPRDHDAIHQLTLQAFEEMPYSNGSEAPIIRGLRSAGDLTISLVAEDNGEIS